MARGRWCLWATLCAVSLLRTPAARQSDLGDPVLRAAANRRYSAHDNDYSRASAGPQDDLFSLSRDDLAHIRKAMAKIPVMKGSPLDVVNTIAAHVEQDPSYEWEELAAQFAQQDLVELALWDEDVRELVAEYRPQVVSTSGYATLGGSTDNEEDDTPPPEDREQTQGWLGCLADYDAYIGPFTDQFRYELQLKIQNADNDTDDGVRRPMPIPSWSRLLLDSDGKRPTGLSQGRKHWVGAAELCADVIIHQNITMNPTSDPRERFEEERVFKGMYARLDMPIDLSPLGLNTTLSYPFQLGVCVPDTCSPENITYYIMEENRLLSLMFTGETPVTRNVTNVYLGSTAVFSEDPAAKAAIGIAIGGIIIIIFATCYDGWGRPQVIRKKIKKHVTGSTKGKHDPLTVDELKWAKDYLYESPDTVDKLEVGFAAYSLYTSFTNLFTTRRWEHREFHVPALDGLRVLLIMWIIKGMTYVYGIVYFECWTTDNLITAIQSYTKDWRFMMILSMYHANAGLFFISGFLCVQMWYKAIFLNNDRMTVGLCIKYVILRYMSLFPVLMGMMMFYTCLYTYQEGPLNPSYTTDAANCRTTWWTVLVLFHNVVKTDQQCMSWTWMFAAVFQLNIFSLFVILIPLALARVAAYVLLALMYIAHITILVIWNQKVMDDELSWYYDIVQTPWCNAGPYCIGMMLAMIMHKHKPDWSSACRKAGLFFLWLFAWAGILICIYMRWDKFKGESKKDWSREGEIAFDVLSPQIFSLSLAWVVYACHYGYGGIFGSLLNWRAFTALSKVCLPSVTFMGPVMTGYVYARYQTIYIHENHMGNLYYGHLVHVFIFGVFAAVFYHHPIGRSFKKQGNAVSRLELFLHCRHPEILNKFSGVFKEDKAAWTALEDERDDRGEKGGKAGDLGGGGGLGSGIDIMRGLKPIGGYVPHQELDGIPEIGDNFTTTAAPVAKPVVVNGVKVVHGDLPPKDGYENRAYVHEASPPRYQEVDPGHTKHVEVTEL